MRLLIFVIAFVFANMAAASLTPVEQQIKNYVDSQKEQQIDLLEQLVNINSGTSNIDGVKQVGAIMRQELDQLGFKTRWVDEPDSFHRAPTLIAERTGKQGKRILLIGHLDTVFSEDNKFQEFTRKKLSAKGPGIIDDKGGMIVLLYALKAMHAAHVLDNTNITVVLTGDEEDSGKPASISRKPLVDIAHHTDVALDFEPAMTLDTSTIARRGISMWSIESHGNESHSATIFKKGVGDGAIYELSRILSAFHSKLKDKQYLTVSPGLVLAGNKISYDDDQSSGTASGKHNIVAKIAYAKGDLRYLSAAQKENAEKIMQKIVQQHLPGTKSTITFQDGIPAMTPKASNLALLKQYSKVSEDAGQGVVKPFDPGLRGAGDISYVAEIVPANLAGLGPIGFGTHSIIESIELNSIPIQAQRAALLIYRLSR